MSGFFNKNIINSNIYNTNNNNNNNNNKSVSIIKYQNKSLCSVHELGPILNCSELSMIKYRNSMHYKIVSSLRECTFYELTRYGNKPKKRNNSNNNDSSQKSQQMQRKQSRKRNNIESNRKRMGTTKNHDVDDRCLVWSIENIYRQFSGVFRRERVCKII